MTMHCAIRLPAARRPAGALWLLLVCVGAIAAARPAGAQGVIVDGKVAVDQQKLADEQYTLREVLEAGEHLFSVPFGPDDFWGEGPDGPRAFQRRALYPYDVSFPLLRVNGLDSQSCFECHLSIGTFVGPGAVTEAMARKPGGAAGAAGIASTAMINDEFPTRLTKFLRNPPHTFGSAYLQELAGEISIRLKLQREVAKAHAMADPGITKTMNLEAKGVSYGVYRVTFNQLNGSLVEDYGAVTGVAEDLIVRPFQWKGIASDIRHFTAAALNFHFSVQPEELLRLGAADDMDGEYEEMSVGNLSALVAFVGMVRPPVQVVPAGSEAAVDLGAQLFRGAGSPNVPAGSRMCAECHMPRLLLDTPVFEIEPLPGSAPPAPEAVAPFAARDVVMPEEPTGPRPATPSLINPVPDSRLLPINREFERFMERPEVRRMLEGGAMVAPSAAVIERGLEAPAAAEAAGDGVYRIDLTDPGDPADLPAFLFDRLPAEGDGRVMVPLYSDLRTHDMGRGLTDVTVQQTDDPAVSIPPRHFLTRPLWGVADTAPYLHDGRALTLRDAIRGHALRPDAAAPFDADDLDPSSEAFEVVNTFENALTDDERAAVLAFLGTLRLPAITTPAE